MRENRINNSTSSTTKGCDSVNGQQWIGQQDDHEREHRINDRVGWSFMFLFW